MTAPAVGRLDIEMLIVWTTRVGVRWFGGTVEEMLRCDWIWEMYFEARAGRIY